MGYFMHLAPHDFWQTLFPPGTHFASPEGGYRDFYPASLPDGRHVALPIRVLPGDGNSAVASLIVNQASFAALDAIAEAMTAGAQPYEPDIVIGVPTLGLPLAESVARRLGHARFVALGTSRKFWYEESLSQPMASITSPGQAKRLYLDPRMVPLLAGRRVALVDDVISSGASMLAALTLLRSAGFEPVVVAAGMLQGAAWRDRLGVFDAGIAARIVSALVSPRLVKTPDGLWRPDS